MHLLNQIKEWMADNKTKSQFVEMWSKKNRIAFNGQKDELDEYHIERAWDLYQSQLEIERLKDEITSLHISLQNREVAALKND